MSESVLVIEDCPFQRERLERLLGNATAVGTREDAGRALAGAAFDLVLLDVHLADGDGLALVKTIRARAPEVVVVALSDDDEVTTMQRAFGAGVDDYICKASIDEDIREVVRLSYAAAAQRRGLGRATCGGAAQAGRADAAGATMAHIRDRIPYIVRSAMSGIHIHGESGTGKEVVAELFRRAVAPRPFLSVNCGAIPETLLESSLFGATRGAYTGAAQDRKGYLEAASGGWIFLDEVACLSPSAQTALLRAIENQEIIRVGDHRSVRIDVRVLSATNESLERLVSEGRFRQDLRQRLTDATIELPPLRHRREEIPGLIEHFLASMPGGPYRIAPAARRILCGLDWQAGNVRELRNCLRAMTETQADGMLSAQSIPRRLLVPASTTAPAAAEDPAPRGDLVLAIPDGPLDFDALTDRLFLTILEHVTATQGPPSVRQLANYLGLSKSAVARRLAEIERARERLLR